MKQSEEAIGAKQEDYKHGADDAIVTPLRKRSLPEQLKPGVLYVSMEYATSAHSCCRRTLHANGLEDDIRWRDGLAEPVDRQLDAEVSARVM